MLALQQQLVDHANTNLDLAGITDQTARGYLIDLLMVLGSQDNRHDPDTMQKIDLFYRLAKMENLPAKYAAGKVVEPQSLKEWQKRVIEVFPEKQFRPITKYPHSMWRMATYDGMVSDTIHCQGTHMPAIMSMVYQPKVIVEMGVRDGTTTLLLCKLNHDARVYGVDVTSRLLDCDVPTAWTAMMHGVDNLTLAIMSSWELSMPGQVDLCFIDADHCGDAPYKDSIRAWENRSTSRDWCIIWDDYHPSNPDVYSAVNRFVVEVGMELQKIGSWYYIGTKPHSEVMGLL